MARSEHWDDLTAPQKVGVMLAVSVQISLAVSAWADLYERPAEQVNGRKAMWACIIAVNFVGPLAYFAFGRRKAPAEVEEPTPAPA